MLARLSLFWLLMFGLVTGPALAQSPANLQGVPLCELQTKLAQADRHNVRVEGVYLSGLEGQYLVTSGCAGRSTYVEFELKTHRLWKELGRLSNKMNTEKHVAGDGDPVLVTFEGEFYGPPVPDANLPDAIRKNYHPRWDPMNASMTKMVVRKILKVEPLPADHPCAPPKSDPHQWPCFQNPSTGSGSGAADGAAFDVFKGVATARSEGTSILKGAFDSLKEGTLTALFGAYTSPGFPTVHESKVLNVSALAFE